MNEKRNTGNPPVIGIILGVLIGVILFVFVMPFALMVIVWGGEGKWDDEKKITKVVTEHQETFQDIVSQLLAPEQDLDFVLHIEEKEFQALGTSKDTEEELYNLEDIYRSADELKIQEIYIYKDSDVDMAIFQTYGAGNVGSSQHKGFFYLEGGVPEKIFEYNLITIYRIYNYSAITGNWYYYELSY